MSHHLSSVEHIDEAMHDCITNCSDCHDICMATVQHCLQMGGEHAAPELIRTLLDCAQTCDTSQTDAARLAAAPPLLPRLRARVRQLRQRLESSRTTGLARVRRGLSPLHGVLPKMGGASRH